MPLCKHQQKTWHPKLNFFQSKLQDFRGLEQLSRSSCWRVISICRMGV